jgi:hypothetical protein
VQETRRCPDKYGVSHPDIANKQMQTVGDDYRARAYSLLTSVHDFAEFTTQGMLQHHMQRCAAKSRTAWRGPKKNDDSVEVWHNYVHSQYSGSDSNLS